MRTTQSGDPSSFDADDPIDLAPEPFPSEAHRDAEAHRRVMTLAAFAVVALLGLTAWLAWPRAERPHGGPTPAATDVDGATAPLAAGTYRLPGLSSPVSVTVPDGWVAGASSGAHRGSATPPSPRGGPAPRSASPCSTSTACTRSTPAGEALDRPGDPAWFERSLDEYRRRVEPRVRDRVVGRRLDWRPPPVLAWLLTFTRSGPIEVAGDVTYDGRPGDLASFAFPGPARTVFEVPGRTPDHAAPRRHLHLLGAPTRVGGRRPHAGGRTRARRAADHGGMGRRAHARPRPLRATAVQSRTYVSQSWCLGSSPFVAAKNADCSSFVTGPRWPSPTSRSSTSRIGVSSAAVPVKKHSSAL